MLPPDLDYAHTVQRERRERARLAAMAREVRRARRGRAARRRLPAVLQSWVSGRPDVGDPGAGGWRPAVRPASYGSCPTDSEEAA